MTGKLPTEADVLGIASRDLLTPYHKKIGRLTDRLIFFETLAERGRKGTAYADEANILAHDAELLLVSLDIALQREPSVARSSRVDDARAALVSVGKRLKLARAALS